MSVEAMDSSKHRRKVVAAILVLWSMRIARTSFLVTSNSIQLPRSGMMRAEWSGRSPSAETMEKSTPGERWSWETMTRSAPFTMNSPPPIMMGNSPR